MKGLAAAALSVLLACGGTEGVTVDPPSQSDPPPVAPAPSSAPVQTGPIVNGGFESGNLDGWRATGAVSVVGFDAHQGVYAADVGGPASGDSFLQQSFVVPSGETELSFWYRVACAGAVGLDWAYATVRDDSTGATQTVLPDSCDPLAGWQSAVADLTSMVGDSVTLTLANHDGAAPGVGAFALYDDVGLASPAFVCTSDAECAAGLVCKGGSCEWVPPPPQCVFDSDCSSGDVCAAGSCQPAPPPEFVCSFDSDCSSGDVCSAGSCQPAPPPDSCTDDSDCGDGQTCGGGSCQDPPPPDDGRAPRRSARIRRTS